MDFKRTKRQTKWRLLFDRECPLCRQAALLLQSIDKNTIFDWSDIREPKARTPVAEFALIAPEGRIYEGEDALAELFRLLPQTGSFRWLFEKAWIRGPLVRASGPAYRLMRTIRRGCRRCPQ